VICFQNLSFRVEGAAIHLDGRYKIREGELDFKGQLRLPAALRQSITGVEAVLVKPPDPLFKKDGACTLDSHPY